jgi:hypothetical protein
MLQFDVALCCIRSNVAHLSASWTQQAGKLQRYIYLSVAPEGVISTKRSITPPQGAPLRRWGGHLPHTLSNEHPYRYAPERSCYPSAVGKSDYSPNRTSSPVRTCANSSPPTRRGILHDSREL